MLVTEYELYHKIASFKHIKKNKIYMCNFLLYLYIYLVNFYGWQDVKMQLLTIWTSDPFAIKLCLMVDNYHMLECLVKKIAVFKVIVTIMVQNFV